MGCRIAFTKPIFSRKEMKTAIPPNGVTARCVSRRINRSSDNRATISRGTGLSVAFDSIPLLSQILQPFSYSELRFSGLLVLARGLRPAERFRLARRGGRGNKCWNTPSLQVLV